MIIYAPPPWERMSKPVFFLEHRDCIINSKHSFHCLQLQLGRLSAPANWIEDACPENEECTTATVEMTCPTLPISSVEAPLESDYSQ